MRESLSTEKRLSHTTNTEQDAEDWLRHVALERVQETFTNGFQFRQTPRYPSHATREFLDRNAERGWTSLADFRGLRRDRVGPHSQIGRPDASDYHGGYVEEAEGYAPDLAGTRS